MRRSVFVALVLFIVVMPSRAAAQGKVARAEGKFGKALDARGSPVIIDGDPRFRRPPLTVECWARLRSKAGSNVLVACDPRESGLHWEIYTLARTGEFSAYVPGVEPAEIRSGRDICDGRWHHVAMLYDGKEVRLVIDGREAVRQPVQLRHGVPPLPGSLTIGMTLKGKERIGCDGVIDDVRLSRTLRQIDGVPNAPLPLDPLTIGLWPFDRAEDDPADPAWTPQPAVGDVPAWEKMTDKDWIDPRFRSMDTGPFLGATFDYPSWQGKVRCYKGTAIRIGEHGQAAVLFDRNQLRLAAGWTGGFLRHSNRRFALLNTPTPAGQVQFASASGPGWADVQTGRSATPPATAPLPRDWAHYRGLYLHGKRTVLSYTVGTTDVLESPWIETAGDLTAFVRTLTIGPASQSLRMRVCDLPGDNARTLTIERIRLVTAQHGQEVTSVALVGDRMDLALSPGARGRLELVVPPHDGTLRFKLLIWHGPQADWSQFVRLVKASAPPEDLHTWTKPGPARWTTPVMTRGAVGADQAPYVIDTLTVPYNNPYKALMFLSGIDFLPNGDLAVCTAHGDVWLVQGVDDKLERLTWKRFATGLYQPLGLKVVDGVIHVLERGQLTRLHDTNGDGEADFYECLNGDWHVGGGEHSFDTCLETDPRGNFYFFKTGDSNTPTGGCLLRVSRDGSGPEIFATGFRHPIGLSVSPTGVVIGADQEGNWMPATRIDVYRRGGFYGDMRTHHRATPPKVYDPPLCWLPREMDNSAGGQVWVPEGKFGPLSGQLLHLSYGRCKIMLVLRQALAGGEQGGAVDLGLRFLSGVMRGRFRPGDGHLYVVGLNGWQTAAVRDGCLQRVRYTGKPVALPIRLDVYSGSIRLEFTQPLAAKKAQDVGRYRVEQWNYHWSGDYGSKRWSVVQPKRTGQDAVAIQSAHLVGDGRAVLLGVAGLRPVMQMQISYTLATASGEDLTGSIYNTIHDTPPVPP
jgi:hypothetical protein